MIWKVASVMTTDVAAVSADAEYKDIVEQMRARGVSGVPVVDADRRVIGVVSEADLLQKEEQPAPARMARLLDRTRSPERARARDAARLMTSPAVTVLATASLADAARLMRRRGVKRLPVVDTNGRLVGIVSRADLLEPYLRSDDSIADEVRQDVIAATMGVDPAGLTVTVLHGVVRLEGELPTRSLARILVRLVGSVAGVVGVDDRLRWQVDDSSSELPAFPLGPRYSS